MAFNYSSFRHLSASVTHFKMAQYWWNQQLDSIRRDLEESKKREEALLQESWADAHKEYVAAMKDLSEGK